jgi:hypothetical protein
MIPKTYMHPKNPVFRFKGRYYERTGRCQPKKCGSLCCKIVCAGNYQFGRYWWGFFEARPKRRKGYTLVEKTCKFLKNGRCSRWKNLPVPCHQFPIIDDNVYTEVKKVCTFKFRRISKKRFEELSKKRMRVI